MASNNNNNIVFAIAMCVIFVVVGFASAAVPLARSASNAQERVYDFTISDLKDSVSWTAFGREWFVHLELSNVVEDNTDYYHGTLEGDASAVVSFALLPGLGLSGMIITGETTWWIRAMPLASNGMSEAEADLGIFMIQEQSSLQTTLSQFATPLEAEIDVEIEADPSSSCASESLKVEVDASADALNERKRTPITTYKVGVLYDQKWATASNNPWSSQADTLGLFNDVNAIYKASGLGQFQAVYLKQVTNSLTTLNDMLNYFSDTASDNIAAMKDTSYTNYVWLVGTNVGGLAYVGTTCQGTRSAQNKKTAVAGLVSYSRLFTVKTIAHELAHNRGAVHEFDNACSKTATTNCQCSVMSYCFPSASNNPRGAVNFFSDTSVAKMQATGCY